MLGVQRSDLTLEDNNRCVCGKASIDPNFSYYFNDYDMSIYSKSHKGYCKECAKKRLGFF